MRCSIEEIAGKGCFIVRKSKFTGLVFFTALIDTHVSPLKGRLEGRASTSKQHLRSGNNP